jgi:hypothetical protein
MTFAIPNSYQTPNVLVDEIMPLLAPQEWVVLSFAVRSILGWRSHIQDRQADISLTQFEKCGLSRPAIVKALEALKAFNLLKRIGDPGSHGQRWELILEDIDTQGLVDRQSKKAASNFSRTDKARRSVRLTTGQSDIPGVVSPTNREGGQSDLHNETQGIQTQSKTQDTSAPALPDAAPASPIVPKETSPAITPTPKSEVPPSEPIPDPPKRKVPPKEKPPAPKQPPQFGDCVVAFKAASGIDVMGRCGDVIKATLATYPDATPDEITAFFPDWKRTHPPDVSAPIGEQTFPVHFGLWRKWKAAQPRSDPAMAIGYVNTQNGRVSLAEYIEINK